MPIFTTPEYNLYKVSDGEDGIGIPGKDGVTLYTWIRYSQYEDGTDMTNDSTGAKYIGIAYNKETKEESDNKNDYMWSLFCGEDGNDAFTIILSNENITFSTDHSGKPLSNQSFTCDVIVMNGASIYNDFIIGTPSSASGINVEVENKSIILSVTSTTTIESASGSISIPITIQGNVFNKTITYSIAKAGINGNDGITLHTWIKYADSPTSGMSGDPDGKKYLGIAYNKTSSTPSNNYEDYSWSLIEGDGIQSTVAERAKNTSNTTPPLEDSEEWTTDNIQWEYNTYIWTRLKITYKSGKIEYTDPQVSSEWEAANKVQDNLNSAIKTIESSISGVSSKVDQNTKSITDKVWQEDITQMINSYDSTTSEAIRKRVTETEKDIGGIKETVSEVNTELIKKADGSVVTKLEENVSKIQQTNESITQEVSSLKTTSVDLSNRITNLQQSGLAWKVNYNSFENASNGDLYLHGYDDTDGSPKDIDGWVTWNGSKITISKSLLNPNSICPYNIPIYVVYRTSDSKLYFVWYKEGWKYAITPTPTNVGGIWEWSLDTDAVLGCFSELTNDSEVISAQLYNPPISFNDISISEEVKSTITQTANGITAQVQSLDGRVTTLSGNLDGITTRVTNAEGKLTSTEQTANKISWLIKDESTESSLVLTTSALDVINQNINLTGKVTFASFTQDAVEKILQFGLDAVEETPIYVTTDSNENVVTDTGMKITASGITVLRFYNETGEDCWTYFYGKKVTIPSFTVNLSLDVFNCTNGYIVYRINSNPYIVWVDTTDNKWKARMYDTSGETIDWDWQLNSDVIIAGFSKRDGEAEYWIYTPSKTFMDIKYNSLIDNWATDANSSFTTINGGLLQNHTILTKHLAADAITSYNYIYDSSQSLIYSQSGTFFDLETGLIRSKNFAIDENGNGYFKGIVEMSSGKIGGDNGFIIDTNKMYTNGHINYDSAVNGIYIGNDYISLGNGGVTYFSNDGTGKIGNWLFDNSSIYNSSNSMYFGNNGLKVSDKFVVTSDGSFTSTAANIKGTINSISGTIGGWTIGKTSLYNNLNSIDGDTAGIYLGTNGIRNRNSSGKTITIKDGSVFHEYNGYAMYLGYSNDIAIYCWDLNPNSVNKFILNYDGSASFKSISLVNGITISNATVLNSATTTIKNNRFSIGDQVGMEVGSYGSKVFFNVNGTTYQIVGNTLGQLTFSGSSIVISSSSLHLKTSAYIYSPSGDYRIVLNNNGNFISTNGSGTDGSSHVNLGSGTNYWGRLNYTELNKVSDRRKKNDLGDLPIEETLKILNGIIAKKFTMKDDLYNKVQYGVYAQDIRDMLINNNIGYRTLINISKNDDSEILVDLESPEDEVIYGVDYEQLIIPLVQGWQYQESLIKKLENRISELEKLFSNV